jgi:cytochrome c peroxidase
VETNAFDSAGRFTFSTSINSGSPQTLYRLLVRLPTTAEALPQTIALFKTPTLRDLDQSSPYLHNGTKDSLTNVLQFYQDFSTRARLGEVRNAAPELKDIFLDDSAIGSLTAFLFSLNEDYTD